MENVPSPDQDAAPDRKMGDEVMRLVGHTHNNVDALFATITKASRQLNLLAYEDLVKVVRES